MLQKQSSVGLIEYEKIASQIKFQITRRLRLNVAKWISKELESDGNQPVVLWEEKTHYVPFEFVVIAMRNSHPCFYNTECTVEDL